MKHSRTCDLSATRNPYVQGNEKVLTKNPKYWDTECKRFDTVTYKMVESNDIVYQMYELSLIHI